MLLPGSPPGLRSIVQVLFAPDGTPPAASPVLKWRMVLSDPTPCPVLHIVLPSGGCYLPTRLLCHGWYWYSGYCPTRIPVLGVQLDVALSTGTFAIGLRASYAMSGTHMACGVIGLRLRYAMSGNGVGYGATHFTMCLVDTLARSVLHDVLSSPITTT
eukprot:2576952-Rhodomonas_salina.1